jgi:bifunctional polynucleotide phosphatase/kinase
MGPPGSGKSTFYHNYMSSYERISQDKLGTADKCIKACRAALESGKSAVIDNTNKTKEQRSRYTSIA